MIPKIFQRLSIICFLMIIIACNTQRGNPASKASLPYDTLAYIGCQKIINLEVGSIIQIKLDATTGTGYQWILKEPSPLVEQLKPDVLKFSTAENKEAMPGHQSYQILQFKAMKKGEGQIQLDYRRTFEAGIEKSCIIKIVVK
jgi:predicted secreted protein